MPYRKGFRVPRELLMLGSKLGTEAVRFVWLSVDNLLRSFLKRR